MSTKLKILWMEAQNFVAFVNLRFEGRCGVEGVKQDTVNVREKGPACHKSWFDGWKLVCREPLSPEKELRRVGGGLDRGYIGFPVGSPSWMEVRMLVGGGSGLAYPYRS